MKIRPYIPVAIAALFLGTIAFCPSLSLAQEQSEGQRKIVIKVDAVYPELARKLQISGTVKVEAVVAPNGKMKLTQVIGGNPVLAKAAVEAIEKWKWVPAPQETKELVVIYFRSH